MKPIFSRIALCAAAILFCTNAFAQYKPSTKWPYVYEHFSEGTVYQLRNNATIEGKYNVCIDNGKLHFIDDKGVIMEAGLREISRISIGQKMFMNVSGKLMEVVAESEDGYVLLERSVSEAPKGVDIGFGIVTDNYSTSNVDLTTVLALGSSLVQTIAEEAMKEREYGTTVEVDEKYQLRTANGLMLPATKSDFQDYVGKKESKEFLKANKVDWKKPATMLPVLKYIREMNN